MLNVRPATPTDVVSHAMDTHDVRIAVPRTDELRADVAALLPLIAPPGREPARTMAVLARQPELLGPFLGWAAALALNGVLPNRDHELLAFRVASNCGSEFEWVEHAEYARGAGLTDAEIAIGRAAIAIFGVPSAPRPGVLGVFDPLELGAAVRRDAQREQLVIAVGQHTVECERRGPTEEGAEQFGLAREHRHRPGGFPSGRCDQGQQCGNVGP